MFYGNYIRDVITKRQMFFSTSDIGACFKILPTSFLYKIDGGVSKKYSDRSIT